MIAKNSDWYKYGWDLGIKNQSWTENTPNEVDFMIEKMNLKGNERILDLACGYGRHALEFARRGYSVVGIDITKDYVDDGNKTAAEEGIDAKFYLSDIRDVAYENEFDVVLNLADGAIGYLESDAENLKIFNVIAKALKHGGKHFMDIGNAEHAEAYFPMNCWDIGEQALALAKFEWDSNSKIMLFGGYDIPYGKPANKPEIVYGDPTRLYSTNEIAQIFAERGMKIKDTWSDYTGTPASCKFHQLMIYSVKE